MVKPVISNHAELQAYFDLSAKQDYEGYAKYHSPAMRDNPAFSGGNQRYTKNFISKSVLASAPTAFTEQGVWFQCETECTPLADDLPHPFSAVQPAPILTKGEKVTFKQMCHIFFDADTGLIKQQTVGLLLYDY